MVSLLKHALLRPRPEGARYSLSQMNQTAWTQNSHIQTTTGPFVRRREESRWSLSPNCRVYISENPEFDHYYKLNIFVQIFHMDHQRVYYKLCTYTSRPTIIRYTMRRILSIDYGGCDISMDNPSTY